MNRKNLEQAKRLVKASYINQGEQALNARRKLVTALLSNRRLPPRGWDDAQIEYFLGELALMDSNNFVDNVGVGEREGRVYCSLVARRHYRLSHGVGRSGDVAEVQPKAAGSSLMAQLCHALAGEALRISGLSNARASLVLPMATGMSLALTFAALRSAKRGANLIVWTRMDQKSCFKAIIAAGFTPVVVENLLEGDAVVTDVAGVKAAVDRCGVDNVLCVVTTTSCFAPRLPDKVDEVARVCSAAGVGHVINNAYGVQCSKTCRLINRAMTIGRVDAVVQSTDKNFMVPVGGAIVCGPDPNFIEKIGKSYAGRASAAPCVDLLMTLLSMGEKGWRRLLQEREALVDTFRQRLKQLAERNGERLLESGANTISFAITLDTLAEKSAPAENSSPVCANGQNRRGILSGGGVAFLGSMLFTRCVSGTRVIPRGQKKTVAGVDFTGYGASVNGFPHDYLTAACAVGLSEAELEEFVLRLDKTIRKARGEQRANPAVVSTLTNEVGGMPVGVMNGSVNGTSTSQPAAADSAGQNSVSARMGVGSDGDHPEVHAGNGQAQDQATTLESSETRNVPIEPEVTWDGALRSDDGGVEGGEPEGVSSDITTGSQLSDGGGRNNIVTDTSSRAPTPGSAACAVCSGDTHRSSKAFVEAQRDYWDNID